MLNKEKVIEDLLNQLSSFSGFDGWWDSVEDKHQKGIKAILTTVLPYQNLFENEKGEIDYYENSDSLDFGSPPLVDSNVSSLINELNNVEGFGEYWKGLKSGNKDLTRIILKNGLLDYKNNNEQK